MQEKDIHAELTSIRSLMERSTKFISLSGLSGILAGIYALLGAGMGYLLVSKTYPNAAITESYAENPAIYQQLIWIASNVLVLSILTGILLTIRQANRKGERFWNPVSKRLLVNMAIPLGTGGLFVLILLLHAEYSLIASACLIFYGLSLITASQYTFSFVKWLGGCEVLLGLLAALLPAFGLLFWVIGFGFLHIIYGAVMHVKYNR